MAGSGNLTSPFLPQIIWGPYLTGTTNNSTMVNIKTDIGSTTTVEYATDAFFTANGSYSQIATDDTDDQLHHIVLAGLSPGTIYHYRVNCGSQTSNDLHFRTFPDDGPISFVVYGDTQDQLPTFSQRERHLLVADRIAEEEDVLFVLHAGDLVNDGSNLSDWDRYFAAGRAMMANTTVYPAPGNHEDNTSNYYEAYGLPEWYSFNCGRVHVTILDSTTDGLAHIEDQTAWFVADLTGAAGADWKFLLYHHPPYTSEINHFGGYENVRSEWEDDISGNGVDAVFNGHVHAYERFLVNHTPYFVIGTGGGPAVTLNDPRAPGSLSSLEYALGYARVDVDPSSGTATVRVIRVADVSGDLKNITTIYPPGTVFETVVLTHVLLSGVTVEPSTTTAPFSFVFLERPAKNTSTWAWIFGDHQRVSGFMRSGLIWPDTV